ncbi:MAG: CDGSH iron-sulfur domain-containing protein [Chloroflexota bacterium]
MPIKSKRQTYQGESITISFDLKRCIHAAECGRRLPAVFDANRRPWVEPDAASADEIAAVVERCPSGALQFERTDGATSEVEPSENLILPTPNGPLYVQGQVRVSIAGETNEEKRVILCRCGASKNKPFCDNAHQAIDFEAIGGVADNQGDVTIVSSSGTLEISTAPNGPYLLRGNFDIRNEAGTTVFQGSKAALCRCGGSQNKPFCDGAHAALGVEAE